MSRKGVENLNALFLCMIFGGSWLLGVGLESWAVGIGVFLVAMGLALFGLLWFGIDR